MLIFLLFFNIAQAQDMSSERYCFSSANAALVARQKFAGIQVPSDVVTVDESCLTIQMRPHRRELIQRYILSISPQVNISFSSEDIKRDPCLLKVEKIKSTNSQEVSAGIGRKNFNLAEENLKAHQSETMSIQTLDKFELTVDQDQILGNCRLITPNRYEIQLEVSKLVKPIVNAPLPPNSVIVLNTPPPDQETMKLSTQLILNKGDRIEIGSVIKDLKDKQRDIGLSNGANASATKGKKTEQVFLSLQ